MLAVEIQSLARQLYEAHGDKALPEAAQKAQEFAAKGDETQAETWRRIEQALLIMRGPHAS
jgi:hypothetical protein